MFFFLSQFLQDVRGYSPLRTGVSFLPLPVTIFLVSQLTSRVLVERIRPKALMLTGVGLALVSLALASQVRVGTPFPEVLGILVLLAAGSGISFVSLTSASLAGVPPADAGAASGLVNVSQQIGAAVGLAALVTVFGAATHHAQLVTSGAAAVHARLLMVHGLDDAFAAAALFAFAALVAVAVGVRPTARPAPAQLTVPQRDAAAEREAGFQLDDMADRPAAAPDFDAA